MDGRDWRRWLADRKEADTPGTFELGSVTPQVMAVLKDHDIELQSAAIIVSKSRIGHMRRAI